MEQHTTVGIGRKLLPPNTGVLVIFSAGDEQGRKIPLVFERTIFGRKSGDIILRDALISSTHMAIEFDRGKFRVVDLGSSNGTFVRGEKIKQAQIELEEEIRVGQTILRLKYDPNQTQSLSRFTASRMNASAGGLTELLDREFIEVDAGTLIFQEPKTVTRNQDRVLLLKILTGQEKGKEIKIKKLQVSLGRIQCDIILPDQDISRKHAVFDFAEGGKVILRDLASSNGTFVNDMRISDCVLEEKDRIRVGQTTLLYMGAKAV